MKYCPKCANSYQDTESVCPVDGTPLSLGAGHQSSVAGGSNCPGCGAPAPVGAAFCPHCGAKIEMRCHQCRHIIHAGDAFCSACGAAHASVPAPRPHEPTPTNAAVLVRPPFFPRPENVTCIDNSFNPFEPEARLLRLALLAVFLKALRQHPVVTPGQAFSGEVIEAAPENTGQGVPFG